MYIEELRKALRKFNEDGRLVERKHWKIAKGGYDLWFSLYYCDLCVIECCDGTLENVGFAPDIFSGIKAIILEEYPDLEKYN